MPETYEIEDVEATIATSMALLCKFPDKREEVWVPRSLINEESEVQEEGDRGTLIVAGWFAEKEELI